MDHGRVVVAGGSGFVGRRLVAQLVAAGRDVRVLTRRPAEYDGPGVPVYGDVSDRASLDEPLVGCTAAYYLVHSLGSSDFESVDADAAESFGHAAGAAGVRQIVYLGGLGAEDDDLSAHLRSRREVESLLGVGGVPVTVLRAGIVIGHGGISWEITRQLVEHLPAMITPRWVRTRTQPIAIDDVIRYLVGVLENPRAIGGVFDIGGPEVLEYAEMLGRVAAIEGRKLPIVPVPLLSPALSSRWLAFVTDVDTKTGRNLIDSMSNEVIVTDRRIREIVPFEPMSYDDAVRAALSERASEGSAPGNPLAQQLRRLASLDRVLPKPLTHVVAREHAESDEVRDRRRRVVAATSVAGAALLGASMSTRPGSRQFYVATAATAGMWTLGGISSGPLHLGWIENRDSSLRRPVLTPIATGVGAFGFFYGVALVARRVPLLDDALRRVLRFADAGDDRLVLGTTLANGLAEEVFFRGALYAALGERRPVAATTGVYALATAATRNPALVAAAAVMGSLFGAQRRASGGIQAPMITHATWSALMLRFLPPLFREPPGGPSATAPGGRRSRSPMRRKSR